MNTTGSNNIAVGYHAGDNITTGSQNIIIGADIDAPSAMADGQPVIANMIFGTGLTDTGTIIPSAGKIGIGTAAPNSQLHVYADIDHPFTGGAIIENAGTGFSTLSLINGNSYGWGVGVAGSDAGSIADGFFVIDTDDNPRLFIASSTGNVGIGTTSPAASAILELSTTGRGFLPPRVTTTQRDAISSPAEGLMVYNTTDDALNYYTGSAWSAPGGAGSIAIDDLTDAETDYTVNHWNMFLGEGAGAAITSGAGNVALGQSVR